MKQRAERLAYVSLRGFLRRGSGSFVTRVMSKVPIVSAYSPTY